MTKEHTNSQLATLINCPHQSQKCWLKIVNTSKLWHFLKFYLHMKRSQN